MLFLTMHDGNRARKGYDWDAMNRLYEKGYTENPSGLNAPFPGFKDKLVSFERLEELVESTAWG